MKAGAIRSRSPDSSASRVTQAREARRAPDARMAQRFSAAANVQDGESDGRSAPALPEAMPGDFGSEVDIAALVERATVLGWRLTIDLTAEMGHPSSVSVDHGDEGVAVVLRTEGQSVFMAWQATRLTLQMTLQRCTPRSVTVSVELLGQGRST